MVCSARSEQHIFFEGFECVKRTDVQNKVMPQSIPVKNISQCSFVKISKPHVQNDMHKLRLCCELSVIYKAVGQSLYEKEIRIGFVA